MSSRCTDKYILVGNVPAPEPDLMKWGRWLQTHSRHVMEEYVSEKVWVSTVFLGLDHNFWDDGPPVLFETRIFGGAHDQYQRRCCTWDEAVAMHAAAVELATCDVAETEAKT